MLKPNVKNLIHCGQCGSYNNHWETKNSGSTVAYLRLTCRTCNRQSSYFFAPWEATNEEARQIIIKNFTLVPRQ